MSDSPRPGNIDVEPGRTGQANDDATLASPSSPRTIDATLGAAEQKSNPTELEAYFSLDEGSATEGKPPRCIRVPGYEIVGELGRGGMGVVYKARQISLNRWVALKMVLSGAHAGHAQLARFRAEAQAVADLQHPNIVHIYEIGLCEGLPYFSLEFVEGGSLADKVHRRPQPPREAAFLVETLARAMSYAHQRGIIHRDLKPANVLLSASGLPKITDFGLAKRLEGDSSQTKSGALLGTPSYMSPEQARGDVHVIGPLADVYALGAILYELLTGRPPFLAVTPMDTLTLVIRQEPPPPGRLERHIPRDLDTICLKCLQKEPSKRYATADALAEDLRRFLSSEPILARPISVPERMWRWARRNPKIATLSGSVALLLIAVTCVSTFSYFQIRKEQAATEHERQLAENSVREEARQREFAQVAEKKALQSAKVASDQRALALNTLYDVITKFEEKLQDREEMGSLRKEMIELAIKGLNQVSRSVETAALADRSMGVALQRMGDQLYVLGKTEEALEKYNLSLTIFQKLLADEPDNDWLPWNRAISFDRLGTFAHELKGDVETSRKHFEESMRLREGLLANPQKGGPDPLNRRVGLLVSYDKLANLCEQTGDPRRARDLARKQLKLAEEVLRAKPEHPLAIELLSGACCHLGQAEMHLGNPEGGWKQLERALAVWEKVRKTDPTNGTAKRKMGTVYEFMGDESVLTGQYREALDLYLKAHGIYETMAKKEPQNAELQWLLAYSCFRTANARRLLGDPAAAETDDRQCLKLRQALAKTDPRNLQRIEELMVSQARCGNHLEASKAANALRQRAPRDITALLAAAECYCACLRAVPDQPASPGVASPGTESLRREYAQSALDSVEQALQLGYKDMFLLAHDPGLQPLQSSLRFKELLAKLR
jgi:serine/threonine-protein kinase